VSVKHNNVLYVITLEGLKMTQIDSKHVAFLMEYTGCLQKNGAVSKIY
jgi:hypothetical protein